MAFILAPAYQAPQCNPFSACGSTPRPGYSYRVARPQPRQPQYSPFNNFFSQVDELLSEIDREAQHQAEREALVEAHRQAQLQAHLRAHVEAQREAHRQRQQRKQALRAKFVVNQVEEGWQIDGDINGFEQENIDIEVINENTLKITGNTRTQSRSPQANPLTSETDVTSTPAEATEQTHNSETAADPDTETETLESDALNSDTESHKSYQATVEDEFEDLGAETASLFSSSASTPAESKKEEQPNEKAAVSDNAVAEQAQPENATQLQTQPTEQERVHGAFEQIFKFPGRIDAANVNASFKEGVLKVTIPKAQALLSRRIAIL